MMRFNTREGLIPRSPTHVVKQRGVGARSWGDKGCRAPGGRAICVASNAPALLNPCFVCAARPCAVSGRDGAPFERKRNLSCVLDPCHSFKRGRVEYMIVCVCVSRHGARVALACEGGVSFERRVLKTISRFGIRQLVLVCGVPSSPSPALR